MSETNAEYHADHTHNGSSMLGEYDESPALYHGLHVSRTLEPEPPTPAMVLGSLTHTFTLEPEKFDAEYLVAEGCGARRGKSWDATAHAASMTGKTAVLESQVDEARAMADSVKAHPLASTILERAESIEQSIRWVDPATGLKLKCKPDCLVIHDNTDGLVVLAPDLKTTPDIRKFQSSLEKYRYHVQSQLYRNGIAGTLPDDAEIESLWIVVDKSRTHEVDIFRPPPGMMFAAQMELNVLLNRLAESFATDTWERPGRNRIKTLNELSKWAQH